VPLSQNSTGQGQGIGIKLAVPAVPAHAVDRPDLRRRLDKALSCAVGLVVAPAGAGKTVLLAQWAKAHAELDLVWMDVSNEDNDPVRFCQRLLGHLAEISPDFADLIQLASLNGGGVGPALLEALDSLMAELPEVVIVLDDLHRLSNAQLVSDVGQLADRMPPNIHLVLSTRTDLPLAWSRRRIAQEMIEIRQSDLALNADDSAVMLERIAGRRLEPDCVATLVARTEGWAAGLQLAGMTLRSYQDPSEFVVNFSGDDRLIADYLSEEVLSAQAEERRRLLLRLSVLDKMCADLVNSVTGESNSQLLLEELERESMFLVPLDTHRQWFRFHHLFRDLLRFQLHAQDSMAASQILKQAAGWHLQRGEMKDGVEYLLRAQSWDEVLEVAMSCGSEISEKGEMATVIRWITAVPESERACRRDVSLLLGMLKANEGQPASAEDILGRVFTNPMSTDGERVCSQILLASLAQWRPRPDISIDLAMRGLKELQRGDMRIPVIMNLTNEASLATMATLSCGWAHFQRGDYEAARDWLDRALTTKGATYPIWRISALGSLGLVEAWCGNIGRAAALSDESLAIAKEVGLLAHPSTAEAFLASALAALEAGAPRRGALALHEGVLRAEANRRGQVSWFGHLQLALLHEAEGRYDRAEMVAHAARSDLGAPPPSIVADRLRALQCRLLRLNGVHLQARPSVGEKTAGSPALTYERGMAALSTGERDVAYKCAEALRHSSEAAEPLLALDCLFLRSWLASVDGSVAEAEMIFSAAMSLGEEYTLIEAFVQAGPPIVGLVSKWPRVESEFRNRVLQRARDLSSPPPGDLLADPLTDREIEILSYLPTRFTNTELADRFYVSVNTIKTHIAHIYRKLDVVSRNQAITRAKEIGVL
jgi:LuxR family transcriptional regulator, maltose regulon positive regulatory protein